MQLQRMQNGGWALLAVLVLALPLMAQQHPTPAALPEAEATAVAEVDLEPEPISGATGRPLSVRVFLMGGTELAGTLLDATELPLRTSFGHAQFPLAEVAGIMLAKEGTPVTTVVLHNGDVVTGATDLKKIYIKTEWGQAEVNGPSISSILFTQGVRWISENGFAGTRWKLTAKQPPQPETPAPEETVAPPPGVRTPPRNFARAYYRSQ